jgi:glycosyl transferase family 25
VKIGVYVINLDRSVARREALWQQAAALGLELRRVEAVDGRAIDPKDWVDLDEESFKRNNGRSVVPGEYGCYRSHLKAFFTFLETDDDAAIVIEDDIQLAGDLVERAAAILDAVPKAEMVKLFNHRTVWFRRTAISRLGDEVGRAFHGPQGSAACNLYTRQGARKALQNLKVMRYPVDIALERGWQSGLAVFTVREDIVSLGALKKQTEIASIADYRKYKFTGAKRMVTHFVRAGEYLRRIGFALRA